MNNNSNYFGNCAGQQPPCQSSVGHQDSAAFYPSTSGNQAQGFCYQNAYNHQMYPCHPVSNFYPAHSNFGATQPPPPTQLVGNNGGIIGGMNWEEEFKINTSFDKYGFWNADGFHFYDEAHTQHHHQSQQVQQHAVQIQAPLPVTKAAPQAPIQHQPPQYLSQGHQAPLPVIPATPPAPSNAPSISNWIPSTYFNSSLPPFVSLSTMMPQSRITVTLCNQNTWRTFHELENEMSVDNHGKELFPQLNYEVNGLIRGNYYKFVLMLERIGSYGYTWNSKQKKFETDTNVNVGCSVSDKIFTHIRSGQEFEENGVEFGSYYLFNNGDTNKSNNATKRGPMTKCQLKKAKQNARKLTKERICVNLGCKYMPVVTILEVMNDVCVPRGEFRFEETSFIVVSHYRNAKVRDQKSALNKSVGKKTKDNAQKRLEERSEALSRPDSGYSTSADPTPPPATQYFGANGSLPSTSSNY